MRILVLGGTTEASAFARESARRPDFAATLSLAGRTEAPADRSVPTRIGGFGGVDGLIRWLADNAIEAIVDATHPFAAEMTRHAAAAAAATGLPLIGLRRPGWPRRPGDRWVEVPDLDAAAAAIGETPKRVLVTLVRRGLAGFEAAPHHHYVIRTIDHPGDLDGLPDHSLILDPGPFDLDGERNLMTIARIEVLVTGNCGGAASRPQIEAARDLGLPVVMVAPPPPPPGMPVTASIAEVFAFLESHRRGARRPAEDAE
jgi:precorrin-6A/cobalt-precorrin-6A reductase